MKKMNLASCLRRGKLRDGRKNWNRPDGRWDFMNPAIVMAGLIWNDLCQVHFALFRFSFHYFFNFLILTKQVQASSTMNQSDIRGLFLLRNRADSDILRPELLLSKFMSPAVNLPVT